MLVITNKNEELEIVFFFLVYNNLIYFICLFEKFSVVSIRKCNKIMIQNKYKLNQRASFSLFFFLLFFFSSITQTYISALLLYLLGKFLLFE